MYYNNATNKQFKLTNHNQTHNIQNNILIQTMADTLHHQNQDSAPQHANAPNNTHTHYTHIWSYILVFQNYLLTVGNRIGRNSAAVGSTRQTARTPVTPRRHFARHRLDACQLFRRRTTLKVLRFK